MVFQGLQAELTLSLLRSLNSRDTLKHAAGGYAAQLQLKKNAVAMVSPRQQYPYSIEIRTLFPVTHISLNLLDQAVG